MLTRMQQRRGTAAEWSDTVISSTVILAAGEVGLETDTGRFKIGNGSTVWANLPYYLPENNPTSNASRVGKNNHDLYVKLAPIGPGYSQTITGINVLVPQANTQTPLTVAGLSGQTALLQSWRSNLSVTTPVASIANDGKLTAHGAEFTASVDMNSNKITELGTPTSDADAATKLYVDQAIAGLAWKTPVNLVSLETGTDLEAWIDVPLTGNTGTVELDGHDPLTQAHGNNYRLLLLNQTAPENDGIWVYSDNGTTYTLTRATDSDTFAELKGASVFVQEGDLYGTSSFVQTNHYLSSWDGQDWVQFNGASQITADGGLTKEGNVLAVGGTADRIQINTNSVDISANYVGQTSIDTLGTVTTGTWEADTIAADQGGTGQTSYTVGDILYASSTSALSKLPAGTIHYPLVSGGAGTDPLYAQIVTAGIADSTSTTTGVTYAKIQYVSGANKILGRISSGSGRVEELNGDNVVTIINTASSGKINTARLNTSTGGNYGSSTDVARKDHTHTINDLSDVVITGTPVTRQVIKFNGTQWVNELPSGGISIAASAPTDASAGDAWFDSTDGSLYVRYDDGNDEIDPIEIPLTTELGAASSGFNLKLDYETSYSSSTDMHTIFYTLSVVTGPSSFITNTSIVGTLDLEYGDYATSQMSSVNLWSGSGAGPQTWPANSTTVLTNGSYNIPFIASTDSYFNIFGLVDYATGPLPPYLDISSYPQYLATGISGGSSAQWVQVKANSALEASILTRLSAVEARDTKLEAANAVRVANQAERDSVYPAPVQGNTVFRADLGYEEKYYAAYNVTTNPDGTTGTIGWYRYAGGAPLSQNYALNGDMEINQRGLTSTPTANASAKYGLDCWKHFLGSDNRLSVQSATITGSTIRYAARMGSNTNMSATGGLLAFGQKLESINTVPLRGKTVTVSFYIKFSNATFTASAGDYGNFRYELGYNTTTTNSSFSGTSDSNLTATLTNGSLPTTWTRVSLTGVVPATANNIFFGAKFLSTAGYAYTAANDGLYYDITGVQIEEGPVATPFRRNQPNIQAELAACQRYYYRMTSASSSSSYGPFGMPVRTSSATQAYASGRHPVFMRAQPVLGTSAASGFSIWAVAQHVLTSIGIDTVSEHSFSLVLGSTSMTAGYAGALHTNALSANNYIEFSAEL